MHTLNISDIKHLIIGATILGVGGGGNPETGMHILIEDLNAGLELKICTFNELDYDSYLTTPYYAGSMPAPSKRPKETKRFSTKVMIKALKLLEGIIKENISAVIATEIGGGNTAIALHLGAILGLPLVDGDHAGRSVPELVHSTYYINNIPLCPSIIATVDGNLLIFREYANIESYEAIVRAIAAQSSGSVFVIDSPVTASIASKAAVTGSISRAIMLGETVFYAKNKGLHIASLIAEKLNGFVIFEGKVTNHNLREQSGFLIGNILIEGVNEHKGHELKIWVKNENIIAWKDDDPIVMPPDLIIMIDKNGYGVINSKIKKDMRVTVIAAPAPEIWRTPRGLKVLGPKYFGFNYDYIPVEKLASKV